MNIYFDFCELSYCSMARKFYQTLMEVFKSLIWTVFIPWWIDLDSIELSLLQNKHHWDNSVYVSRLSFTQLSSTLLNKTNTKTVRKLSQLKIFCLLTVEKKLELIFSKNVTKNVRKKSVRKNPYQGKNTDQIRLLKTFVFCKIF